MRQVTKYTDAIKASVLSKLLAPNGPGVIELAKEFINSEDYSDITDEDIEEHISDNYYEYPQTCEEFFSNINDIDKMEYTSKSGDKIIFIIYSDY